MSKEKKIKKLKNKVRELKSELKALKSGSTSSKKKSIAAAKPKPLDKKKPATANKPDGDQDAKSPNQPAVRIVAER